VERVIAVSDEEIFRQELVQALRRELVGPPWSIRATPITDPVTETIEVLHESPVQRYSAGVLFPSSQPMVEIEDAEQTTEESLADIGDPKVEIFTEDEVPEPAADGRGYDAISDAYDETVRLANEFFPAAIGLSFIAQLPEESFIIRPRAAIYKSQKPTDPKSRLREWHRSPLELPPVVLKIPDASYGLLAFNLADHLKLRAIYHRRDDGSYLITVSMLNSKTASQAKFPSGADCFFQVEFDVAAADGRFVFNEYRIATRASTDPEEAALELLYRNRNS
jgi:hypothetical protein